ncbi:MAG: hypothetical protein ACM3KR_10260 [Deltaproteobacteria bacterium]
MFYQARILDPKEPPLEILRKFTVIPQRGGYYTICQLVLLEEAKAFIKNYVTKAYSEGLADLLLLQLEKQLSESNNEYAYTEYDRIVSETLYITIEAE